MNENWNFVGNEWAVRMLREHVARGATRHAYLITGPRGVGRRTLGLRLAQALNCTSPLAPGIPCGTCDACTRLEALKHPDLSIVEAETEGGTLKIDQVRELRRVLVLRPYQAPHRVAMLLRFQEAHEAAANALLKTLEEAPSYAVLILTAESPEGLLPTIVSRCEVLRLQAVPREDVQQMLEQRGAQPAQARLIAHVSEGRPGTAIGMLQDPGGMMRREEKLKELLGLIPGTRAQKFAYAERLSKNKPAMRTVLSLWLSFWRDVFWKVGGYPGVLANVDYEHEIDALAGRLDLTRARQLVAQHDQALRLLQANINARLLAEVLLLSWPG